MKKRIDILIPIIIFLLLFVVFNYKINQKPFVKINNTIFEVETASTRDEQIKGLSGRENLPQNVGLLFVFNDYQERTFWMKEMLIPIDIIWIKDNQIVGIVDSAPIPNPETIGIPTFDSPGRINYVLEINAGEAAKNGIKIGDMVEFHL